MSSNKIELGYWKYRGLAHPLRFALQYLELPYEERNFSLPEGIPLTCEYIPWQKIRDEMIRTQYPEKLPFPNVPYLIDGDKHVSESRAVMKYIARTYKPELLGLTPEIQLKIDMLENYLYDFWYMVFAERIYADTEESIKKFNIEHPLRLARISKFVGNNKWSTGENLTYVDFWLCEFLQHLTAYDAKILDPYPNLKALRDNFQKLPAIAKYMKSPGFIERPYYSPRANYKL